MVNKRPLQVKKIIGIQILSNNDNKLGLGNNSEVVVQKVATVKGERLPEEVL